MGHEGRFGVKDGKDGYEDDQVDVWCFPERQPFEPRKKVANLCVRLRA